MDLSPSNLEKKDWHLSYYFLSSISHYNTKRKEVRKMAKDLNRELLKMVYLSQPRKPEELRRGIPKIAKYLEVSEKELTDFLIELHKEVLTERKPPLS